MPGKAIVAATEETLTIAPPLPAAPSGRIARRPCLMPSAVPSTLTSSMRRRSSACASTSSPEISMPALLTRMSKPPSRSIVVATAASQSASLVTSRWVAWPSTAAAVCAARSSSTSPIITFAPAVASACAMPSPRPRAPPVTSALRPASTPSAIDLSSGWTAAGPYAWLLTVAKRFLDARQDRSASRAHGHPEREAPPPCGQVRGPPSRARDRGAADPRRARLRAHVAARDRPELALLARCRALLLRRQGRADHLLRAPVQGRVRAALRHDRRDRGDRRRAGAGLRGRARGDAGRGRRDAPPLVRPARAGALRGLLPRRCAGDRRHARADDLAGRQPLRRAARRPARDALVTRLRDVRRALPAGAAAPPLRRRQRHERAARRRAAVPAAHRRAVAVSRGWWWTA